MLKGHLYFGDVPCLIYGTFTLEFCLHMEIKVILIRWGDSMRLIKGITGFDSDHLIEQDERTFKSMVYHLASCEQDITVHSFENNHNHVYMKAFIEMDGKIFTILHHRYMPYVAISLNISRDDAAHYFETKKDWHKYFPYRKCLTASELNQTIFENRNLHCKPEI